MEIWPDAMRQCPPPGRQIMMRPSCKVALTVLILLSTYCGSTRAQSVQDPKTNWDQDCSAAFEKAHPGTGLHMLTGPGTLTGPNPSTGYYFKVGRAIASVLADGRSVVDPQLQTIEAISTAQTKCNLVGLETGNADFALVQSDIAHDAWFGHPPIRSKPTQEITLVAPLYVEAVHIVIRPHLNLAQLSDLRGRHVWLGIENSLTVFSARRILDAAGLTAAQIDALNECPREKPCPKDSIGHMTPGEALKALEDLKLDAMFQVGAVPFDSLRDSIVPTDTDGQVLDAERNKKPCVAIQQARAHDPTLKDHELHLFNLDIDLVGRLVHDSSYIEQLIPPDAYCQDSATLTVGVRALLLTNRKPSDRIVHELAAAIIANQYAIEKNIREQVEMEQKAHGDAITGLPAKLSLLRVPTPDSLSVRYHATVSNGKDYFDPWKNFFRRGAPEIIIAGFIVFLALYRWRRVIGPALVDHGEWPIGLILLFLVWVAISLWLEHLEGNVNENYSTFNAAMFSTFKGLLRISDGPVTRNAQLWWSKSQYLATLIIFSMLVPTIRQSVLPWISAKLKKWLLGMGQKTVPVPAPENSGAQDHTASPHPAAN
jgi:TRAP transporter TAXI family solute receptor